MLISLKLVFLRNKVACTCVNIYKGIKSQVLIVWYNTCIYTARKNYTGRWKVPIFIFFNITL